MQYQLAVQIETEHRYSISEAAYDLPFMLLKNAAESNHRDAQILLGDYYRGLNYKAALKWYQAAEDNGHPEAHQKIVMCRLRYGTLTSDDIRWLAQLFSQGNVQIGMRLGEYYSRKENAMKLLTGIIKCMNLRNLIHLKGERELQLMKSILKST